MTWLVANKNVVAVFILIAMVVGFSAAFNHYRNESVAQSKRADEAEHNLALANSTISDMQTRQRDVAALDAKYNQELADANTENDALRHKLDAGSRVRVKGSCPAAATGTTSGSMGNDGPVELSDSAGRNLLDIRAGIISDQQKLKYLQGYIKTQCIQ